MAIMNVEDLDRETARDVERMAVLRVSPKHINLWMRQLEMKRNEICELAGSMGFDEVKNEIASEKKPRKVGEEMHQPLHKKGQKELV